MPDVLRHTAVEDWLYDAVRSYLTRTPRTGIHVSDLLLPRKAYWARVDPKPPSRREVLYFIAGRGHEEVLVALTGLKAHRKARGEWSGPEDDPYPQGEGIRYEMDVLYESDDHPAVPFEIKTTRRPKVIDAKDVLVEHALAVDQLGRYCLSPESRLLTEDLRWVTAASIQPGDRLVGFEERVSGQGGRGRKLLSASVTAMARRVGLRYRITLPHATVIADENHLWFAAYEPSGAYRWTKTKDLDLKHSIGYFGGPWMEDEGKDAGYLAAILDGEGCLSCSGPLFRLSFSQRPGVVLDKALRIASQRGFHFRVRQDSRSGVSVASLARIQDVLRLLGTIRPTRLLSEAVGGEKWIGKSIHGNSYPDHPSRQPVVGIERIGEGEVVSIETDCKTFVAEGLLSHNCAIKDLSVGYLIELHLMARNLSATSTEDVGSEHPADEPDPYAWLKQSRPEMPIYQLTWSAEEREAIKALMHLQRRLLESALAEGDHTRLPECPEWMCGKVHVRRSDPVCPVCGTVYKVGEVKPDGKKRGVVKTCETCRVGSKLVGGKQVGGTKVDLVRDSQEIFVPGCRWWESCLPAQHAKYHRNFWKPDRAAEETDDFAPEGEAEE